MNPYEVVVIFKAEDAECHKINRKPKFEDMRYFEEKASAMLVELPRDVDSDEWWMFHLNQLVEDFNTLTRIHLNCIVKLSTYDSSIISEATEDVRKRTKLSGKRNLITVK